MVNVNLLKGAMAEQGKSQRDVADMLGISERTFYNKMKRKVFDSDEIVQMCNYLGTVSYTHLTLPTICSV